ncbi:MAG: PTS sugar transporter subunit IIA [Rhodothermales bacterium]|nr:PTS sugar transporter subunit IIA [Rhodothermales bacterium]MBO6780232.1 PTS sugar transporter subunit IIA [Rhodothermales bacterium]
MHITNLLSPKTIRVGLQAGSKEDVISRVVDLIAGDGRVTDIEDVRSVVLDRESTMSTGVGKGLGLPHGKTASMRNSIAALAITREPVDFDAFDGQPVRIVFLLVGPPEAQAVHIRTLSRISRLMSRDDVREAVLAARTAKAVYAVIAKAEATLLNDAP